MKVMLLIDADNVTVDVMEQAVERLLDEHGVLHVRRAYCTAESALKHQQVFKRLSIRPMVNLAAGKNSTDIALAVDAIDLCMSERPDVVVIASSDSDFAPLVGRLREKGCRVCGIGQEGKTGAETVQAYDSFMILTHRGADGVAPTASGGRSRRAGTRTGARAPSRSSARPAARTAADGAPSTGRRGSAASPPGGNPDNAAAELAGMEAYQAPGNEADDEANSTRKSRSRSRSADREASRESGRASGRGSGRGSADEASRESVRDIPGEATDSQSRSRRGKSTRGGNPSAAVEVDVHLPLTAPAPAVRGSARGSARTPARSAATSASVPTAPSPKPASTSPTGSAGASAAAAPLSDKVRSILAALPELHRGQTVELRVAAERLRDAGLLGPRASSTKFFAPLSDRFELLPADQPNKLRWRGNG